VTIIQLPRIYDPDFAFPGRQPLSTEIELRPLHLRNSQVALSYVMNQKGASQTIRDLKSGLVGTNTDPAQVSLSRDIEGGFVFFDNPTTGDGDGFDLGDPTQLKISTAITIIAGIRPGTQPGSFGRVISKGNGGGTGDQWGMLIDNEERPVFRINNISLSSTTVLNTGQYYNLAMRYKSGNKSIWIDGLEDTPSTAQTGSITTTGNVRFGQHGDDAVSRSYVGNCYYMYVIAGFLNDYEILSFHRNPYQLVQSKNDVFYSVPTVAAAGRIMSSLANHGGLAGMGGIAGQGGGLAG